MCRDEFETVFTFIGNRQGRMEKAKGEDDICTEGKSRYLYFCHL